MTTRLKTGSTRIDRCLRCKADILLKRNIGGRVLNLDMTVKGVLCMECANRPPTTSKLVARGRVGRKKKTTWILG